MRWSDVVQPIFQGSGGVLAIVQSVLMLCYPPINIWSEDCHCSKAEVGAVVNYLVSLKRRSHGACCGHVCVGSHACRHEWCKPFWRHACPPLDSRACTCCSIALLHGPLWTLLRGGQTSICGICTIDLQSGCVARCKSVLQLTPTKALRGERG